MTAFVFYCKKWMCQFFSVSFQRNWMLSLSAVAVLKLKPNMPLRATGTAWMLTTAHLALYPDKWSIITVFSKTTDLNFGAKIQFLVQRTCKALFDYLRPSACPIRDAFLTVLWTSCAITDSFNISNVFKTDYLISAQ